jgi:very-short-patch-repair endonuclease
MEIDGDCHDRQMEYNKIRDDFMTGHGPLVI